MWLRRQDLNLRPSGYEPDELPDCSTPRSLDAPFIGCSNTIPHGSGKVKTFLQKNYLQKISAAREAKSKTRSRSGKGRRAALRRFRKGERALQTGGERSRGGAGRYRRGGGRRKRAGEREKAGRTFLCAPPVLLLRSHCLIPVIHDFSDQSLIFMSYFFRLFCGSLPAGQFLLEKLWISFTRVRFAFDGMLNQAVNLTFFRYLQWERIGNEHETYDLATILFNRNSMCDISEESAPCRSLFAWDGTFAVCIWLFRRTCTLRCL